MPNALLSPCPGRSNGRPRTAVLLALAVVACGCGKAAYEERLARTADYFAHVAKLNANLVPSADRHGGLAIRVPRQFSPLEDVEDTDYSERQPYYIAAELPGLVAAYQAEVAADGGDGTLGIPAFIYVATNEDRLVAAATGGDGEDPLTFIEEVEYQLQGVFNVSLPAGDGGDGSQPNMRYPEMIPATPVYEPAKRFVATRFQYPGEEPIADFGVPMEYTLYTLTGAGDLQAAIFVVAPEQPAASENLPERIRMMLQTLELTAPRVGSPGSSSTSF